MRRAVAEVKNLRTLEEACESLQHRDPDTPGLALVYGATGAGKTTATSWLAVSRSAIHVRAAATWTPNSMLAAIMTALGFAPLSRTSSMLTAIVESLRENGRTLMIDEADYLVRKLLLETLRDIHDMSTVPVVLIGMADFKKRLMHQAQIAGRISQWVEFGPADLDDYRLVADAKCEVELSDDLLEDLHRATQGSMRGLQIGLTRVEAHAKRAGLERIDLASWGSRPFILPGRGA